MLSSEISKVSSFILLFLDWNKETLKVSSTKTEVISSLNDFEEESWSILNWFSENLKQVTLVVIVNKDFVLLQQVNILSYLNTHIREVFPQNIVISIRNTQEFNTSSSKILNSINDGFSFQSNMLNTSIVVIIDVFLDLWFFLSYSRLVDWHLNVFIIISNDHWSESWVFSVHHFIINRPESVETQTFFIPIDNWLHLKVRLISYDMVNSFKSDWFQDIVEFFFHVMRSESR